MNRASVLTLFLLLLGSFCGLGGDVPANPASPSPGMERGVWTLEPWGNSGTAEKISDRAGHRLLKLVYMAGDKDKASYKHLTYFGIPAGGKLRMWVYSAEPHPPQVSISISTTMAYRWHETALITLKTGWNPVEICASDKVWKTEASDWKNTVSVEPLDEIRAVDLVVYNGKQTGAMYVQGVQYDLDERGKEIDKVVQRLQSDDIDVRIQAEQEVVAFGRPAMEPLHQIAEDDRPEVLLRAASALRKIEQAEEPLPADPKARDQILKQKEEQSFQEEQQHADYLLHSIDSQKLRIVELIKEAQGTAAVGKSVLEKLQYVDAEKRKAYEETLEKLNTAVNQFHALLIEKEKAKDAPKK